MTAFAFDFVSPNRLLFGAGTSQKIEELVRAHGERPLLVTGRTSGKAVPDFGERLIHSGEPTVEDLERLLVHARAHSPDVIVAIGGGSALDMGKALAACLTNEGPPHRYLEVIGEGKALEFPALPVVAVPTTAGTGAEVTKNAVLKCPEKRVKVSMRHPSMVPVLAVVDPDLTASLPLTTAVSTGMDAFVQLVEPFLSHRSNPLTEALCRSALPAAWKALRALADEGGQERDRIALSYASLCSGMALANAGLGAVHGIAGPLGGMIEIPHGVACAALLSPVMMMNRQRTARGKQPVLAGRERALEALLGMKEGALAEECRLLAERLSIPRLGEFGFRSNQITELTDKSLQASSMKGHAFVPTSGELEEVLAGAC